MEIAVAAAEHGVSRPLGLAELGLNVQTIISRQNKDSLEEVVGKYVV